MHTERPKNLLLLSVGYGQGHHAAATALAEQFSAQGWSCRVEDVCELFQPVLFRLTQRFYSFCVRRAPWLWGVTYSLTDTANWARMVRRPLFKPLVSDLGGLLQEIKPDLVICTYPLFAYMLDALREQGGRVPPYAVVVTDAREISRPWMQSESPLVLVPDAGSRRMVTERYALSPAAVSASGFPVRRAFAPSPDRVPPTGQELRIVYGAYRQTEGVINDIAAMLGAFPGLRLTVLAGHRMRLLRKYFAADCRNGRLCVLDKTSEMERLLPENHFYIGKAGAATMFECYASLVPVLVNFTLPGQEQGNLELLLEDGAGYHVESTAHLVATLQGLVQNHAAGWKLLCQAMQSSGRSGGAACVQKVICERFGL